ncbi:MAG: nucleotidyltransferase domain-containing protein [Nanoarchaeota archaeon]|nr:nucleotidyltransferase domain-containing protein [Nanoarchaeota archaeon]
MNGKRASLEDAMKIAKDISKSRRVKAVYLFGSYARGTQTPISDIDICVITGYSLKETEKNDILSNASDTIDILLYEDLPVAIRQRVLNEGKPLFVRDKRFVDDLRWKAFKEYIDFKPIISSYVKKYLPGVHYV